MTIREKISFETGGEPRLYREGVFWMAYEQSAYWFHLQKGYKPTKKYVKTAGQYVVSVGFPDSALSVRRGEACPRPDIYNFKENGEKLKIIALHEKIDLTKFEAWKEGIACRGVLHTPSTTESKIKTGRMQYAPTETVLEKIRNFDLSNATPLQCMNFLSELKQILNNRAMPKTLE